MNRKVDIKLKEYEEYFGEPYVFSYGFLKSEEDIINEIEESIKTGKKQVLPDYDDDYIY